MDTMTELEARYPVSLIERSARYAWWKFKDHVSWDDCYQEAWVAYLEREQLFGEVSEKYIAVTLSRAVAKYCRREKASRCGYMPEDEEFYSLGKLRSLIPFVLAGEPLPTMSTSVEGAGSASTTVVYNEIATELADVARAYERLAEYHQNALWLRYGPDAGDVDESQRAKARRALVALQEQLGGAALRDITPAQE